MKAIMISIRPEWVAKILNGLKTVEIRKIFPSDYVGWVYIYCTKDKNNLLHKNCADIWWIEDKDFQKKNKRLGIKQQPIYNGKVIARVWCNKVEEIEPFYDDSDGWFTGYIAEETWNKELLKKSCLTEKELDNYLKRKNGRAIHITKVKPFDKPKELSEFWTSNYNKSVMCDNEPQFPCTKCPNTGALYCNCKFLLNGNCSCISLTRAPQSWCYVEV